MIPFFKELGPGSILDGAATVLNAVLGPDLAIHQVQARIDGSKGESRRPQLVRARDLIDHIERPAKIYEFFQSDQPGNVLDLPKPKRVVFVEEELARVHANTPPPDPRSLTLQPILDAHRAKVRTLVRFVEERAGGDSASRALAEPAIAALGKVRAVEAVPVLVKYLTNPGTSRPGQFAGPMPLGAALPAVAALVEIGSPVINPLIDRALGGDDEAVTTCAAIALAKILGPDLAAAAARLRVGPGADADRARRLDRLASRIAGAAKDPTVPQPKQP